MSPLVKPERVRRQQLLRQAEGYLELCTACDSFGGLSGTLRKRIVERGIACLDEIDLRPSVEAHVFRLRGQLLRVAERYGVAIDWLKQALSLTPQDLDLYVSLGWCYKRLQRLDDAIDVLEQATRIPDESGIIRYNLACYFALAGDVHATISNLAIAFETRPQLRELVATETDFDPIRDDPDFQAVIGAAV
ncbi:MAG: tetratricopeptide repeat protein [Pirellulaceae bacterium]